jgi:hypothetical protein
MIRSTKSSRSLTEPTLSLPLNGHLKLNVFRSRKGPDYTATPIPDFWNFVVPRYESKVVGPLVVNLLWDSKYAEAIWEISPRRANNRHAGYLDSSEMARALRKLRSKGEASIRFGAEKTGHGYSGERGDFCLVGGVIRGKSLSLLYRSLELIGGFAYDLTLINGIVQYFGLDLNTVTIYATKAFVFALKGNSNEKLYPKLQEIFR